MTMRPMNPAHPADAMLLDFKSALRNAMHTHGVEPIDLADVCMVDPSIVSHWCSRKSRASIGPDGIALAASKYPTFARDLMRWFADHCGLTCQPRASTAHADRVIDHARKNHKEGSELTGALIGAGVEIPDMSDEQLATIDRELRDVEETTAPLRRDVDAERMKRSEARRPRVVR